MGAMWAQKPAGTYYAAATAGLNLRASASPTAEKVALAQYGEKVELLQPAADRSMVVDGISGGMAQVKYNGKTGYAFDGFLSPCVMPLKGEEVEAYAGRLWASQVDVLHEEHRKDYGGYVSMEYALHFESLSWSEAFLVAKNLFGIPAPLQFQGEKGSAPKVTKNPNATETAWTDQLEATYDDSGKMLSTIYSFRAEGGGQVILIQKSTDQNYTLKISEIDIAD